MATYYVSKQEMVKLLAEREGVTTFAPTEARHEGNISSTGTRTQQLAWLDCAGSPPSLSALAQPRAAQSPKGLFLPAAELVARYGAGGVPAAAVQTGQVVLVGVRACELRAKNYLDEVMLEGDFQDPAYRRRSESMTIVSCDCVDCTKSCFCTLVGGLPFPAEGYDVNLTPLEDGYVVDQATERGSQWLGQRQFPAASVEHLSRRDQIRKAMTERLREQSAEFSFSADDESAPALPAEDDQAWQRVAADCVECGACTNICPTCHCFYLYDQAPSPEQFERIRTWDSCLLSTYHRMAGGVNMKLSPRPRLSSRLANRVLHKFSYSPQQYNLLGCVGCGRCVDACPGAIDIRQVVQELGQ